jgi:hypothetical protein
VSLAASFVTAGFIPPFFFRPFPIALSVAEAVGSALGELWVS